MVSFNNIKSYATEFPKSRSFLWLVENVDELSQEHKDQIFFLNEEASAFIRNYINNSKLYTGPSWKPFNERYFKTIEAFELTENCESEIKKWLYSKPIPFEKMVYVYGDPSGQEIALTWKMVIKYWEGLFFADDLIIFDESFNWGLFYFHEDRLFFGSDKIYDKELEYEKTLELAKLKQKYFNKDNLNFTKEEKRNAIREFKEKYDVESID